MSGGESKVQCCKEQYCIGIWSVKSMNQGKLEVVKQEMARVNTDILGISELKWTGMGKFNSDNHCVYYCGQESLRRNDVAHMVNKRVQNVVFGYVYMMDHISIGLLSRVRLFATARTVAHQAPLSKEFCPTVVDIMVI